MVEVFHLCTNHALQSLDVFGGTRHEDAVAHLQTEVAIGKEVHAVTGDARHVDTVDAAKVQLAKSLAVDFGLGDDEAVADVVRLLLVVVVLPVFALHDFTHQHGDGFCLVLSANEMYLHTQFKLRVAIGNEHFIVLNATRDDELAIQERVEFVERAAYYRLVGHLDDHVFRGGVRVALLLLADGLLLLFEFDTQQIANGNRGQDDADNAKGIGASITRGQIGHS